MARSKPNKPKSPHKQQIEEQNSKDKTETTPHIKPQTSKPSKTTTVVKARSNKSTTPCQTYIRNLENIPYYDGYTKYRIIYRHDRNKHQLDEDGEPINTTEDELMQPSDEDAQGNDLPDEEIEKKERTLHKRLQAKKTASHQRSWKLKKAPYLPNSRETDSVSDTMNQKQ
jgi:hypothetical protein